MKYYSAPVHTQACRDFALRQTWQASARIFLQHVTEGAKAWRDKPRRIAA